MRVDNARDRRRERQPGLGRAGDEARSAPDGALVLMHGRGTSEQDLVGLFDLLDPEGRLALRGPAGAAADPRSAGQPLVPGRAGRVSGP